MTGCTRILVTHQLQYLSQADNIVVLRDGKVNLTKLPPVNNLQITHSGTYAELVVQGVDFETLIQKRFQQKEKQPEKADEIEIAPETEKPAKEKTEDVPQLKPARTRRRNAKSKLIPEKSAPQAADGAKVVKLVSNEERQVGAVKWEVYEKYFAASGGYRLVIGTLCMYVLAAIIDLTSSYWLALWSDKYESTSDYFTHHTAVHLKLSLYTTFSPT